MCIFIKRKTRLSRNSTLVFYRYVKSFLWNVLLLVVIVYYYGHTSRLKASYLLPFLPYYHWSTIMVSLFQQLRNILFIVVLLTIRKLVISSILYTKKTWIQVINFKFNFNSFFFITCYLERWNFNLVSQPLSTTPKVHIHHYSRSFIFSLFLGIEQKKLLNLLFVK